MHRVIEIGKARLLRHQAALSAMELLALLRDDSRARWTRRGGHYFDAMIIWYPPMWWSSFSWKAGRVLLDLLGWQVHLPSGGREVAWWASRGFHPVKDFKEWDEQACELGYGARGAWDTCTSKLLDACAVGDLLDAEARSCTQGAQP